MKVQYNLAFSDDQMNQSITTSRLRTGSEQVAERNIASRKIQTNWAIIALIVLSLVTWGASLQCYFLADDFVPLAYMHDGFHGNFLALMQRLVQPWQGASVQLLWRPLSEVSMWFDYLIWHANATGYHLTNVLWHAAATVSFFLVADELVKNRTKAFWAAALFAATPLHTETVSWMIGRVDSISSTFALASFWLFLRGRTAISCISFIAAILSKESAVVLPAVLVAYSMLLGERAARIPNLKRTLPFWLVLLPWFAARLAILGTPIGGYIGSIGDEFSRSTVERLIHCQFDKIFYPFSDRALPQGNVFELTLRCLYAISAGLLLWSMKSRSFTWASQNRRTIAFSLVWLAISLAPVLSVFYLNGALTGSRFLYAASAPLLLLFCSAVPLSTTLVAAFVICFALVCVVNTTSAIKSGNEARKFQSDVSQAVSALPRGTKLALFDAPKQDSNEQIFYTAEMMHAALRPPFLREDISSRVQLLSPNTYIPEDPLNVSLLEAVADRPDMRMYIWNEAVERIEPFDHRQYIQTSTGQPRLTPLSSSFGLRSDSFFVPYADKHLLFSYNAPEGAAKCVVEISKPNSYFMHYTRTLLDTQLSSHAAKRISLAVDGKNQFELHRSDFGGPDKHQIRLAAFDTKGRMIGATSDPLSIDLGSYLLNPAPPP